MNLPLMKGTLNAACFRFDGKPGAVGGRAVPTKLALRRAAFEAIKPESDAERSAGAVEFERTDEVEFNQGAVQLGTYELFQWRVDRLKVPAPALRKALLAWAQGFEAKNGRAPGRVERAEARVMLKAQLRQKQEATTKLYPVAMDTRTGRVFVFASSAGVIDEVQAALEFALEVRLRATNAGRMVDLKNQLAALAPAAPETADVARMVLDHGALGRACLTWLLWKSESTAPIIDSEGTDDAPVVSFFGKASLCGVASEVATAKVTGVTAPYAPLVKQALSKGLAVDSARVRVSVGEVAYEVTLDATTFSMRSVKLPAPVRDEPHERLLERLDYLGQLATLVDRLVEAFARARLSAGWPTTVNQMLAWMRGDA